MADYVIIGNSAAAIGAVEGIRQVDKTGSLTLISREPYHTYSRPLISYLLAGKTNLEKMKYRDGEFYLKNAAELITDTVIKIDAGGKKVLTESGREIPYGKLLVATGSTPFVPPMEGLDGVKNKFTFYTLNDALSLEKAIDKDSKVLIIGAGLIGLKCAEGIFKKAGKITVIDLAPRILSSILDEDGAVLVKEHLEKSGIEFLLNTSVKCFSGSKAVFTDGKEIGFDALVLAIGVRPNVSLLKDAGAQINRGIVTDDGQRTSLKDVYAAGDCAESYDVSSETAKVLALLPCAYMQGETAGVNMAGGNKAYKNAVPMNAMGLFGLHMITAGSYVGDSITGKKDGYKRLYYKDDRLKGYILIGNIEKAGIYTSIISERIPLSELDFELIAEKPGLMAFSKEVRAKKLGGVER